MRQERPLCPATLLVRPLLFGQGMIFKDFRDAADFPSRPAHSMREQIDLQDGRGEKRKAKLRAVWISFMGRVVAQVLGASASIVLGVFFLHKYQKATEPVAQAHPRIVRAASAESSGTSIAVLPLANFSADAHDDYLADGITEALIADLAQVDGLRVISRTSTMPYKSLRKSVPEIARELDVDLIVEGSIVKAGGRVHVTAQLIDADTDEHIWARSYERTIDNVLALQTEVAASISRDVNAAHFVAR